jgi:hypothetical protein
MLGRRILPIVVAATVVIFPSGSAAGAMTVSVNCDSGGDLKAKIEAASSGDTILVKGTCVGNFMINDKSLTIKGNPTATLDGDDVFRPLGITLSGQVVHLTGLKVTGGVATSVGGGGIAMLGGRLVLNDVTVTENLVDASSSDVSGGGIFAAGNLTVIHSTISANRARTTGSFNSAYGGGIALFNANLSISHSVVTGNRVSAVQASGNATAEGGGFYVYNGHYSFKSSTVSGNRATASGSFSADAEGGGGYEDSSTSSDSVTGSTVVGNVATAMATGGFAGGAGLSSNGALHISNSNVSGNRSIATGTTSSISAFGSGVAANSAIFTRSTVNGNRLQATSSSGVASVDGGGIEVVNQLTVTASTVSRNVSRAMSETGHSNADGGGISEHGPMDISNSTIALNTTTASGATSASSGGGLYVPFGPGSIDDSTVAGNRSSAVGPSPDARGGGLFTVHAIKLKATIVANNAASLGPNCFGGPPSNGYNLIGKGACSLTSKKRTDKVGKNPKLGPLHSNGGPTQTMAISSASPAFNAIPKAACPAPRDQRGVHRPQGFRCDIGAYEAKVRSIAIP